MSAPDVVVHLRTIEDAIVAALAEEGIAGRSRPQDGPDYTGVWVEDRKLASLGVHVSHGISTHGFAVNVENDLQPFSWIVACGLPDVTMTSIAAELATHRAEPGSRSTVAGNPGRRLACFRRRIAHHFCRTVSRRQRLVSPRRLGIGAPVAAMRSSKPRGADERHDAPRQPAGELAYSRGRSQSRTPVPA
jgi:lipoyl(octanoyl) transferase